MRLSQVAGKLTASLILVSKLHLGLCSSAVNVGLRASWNGAPFFLELLETAAEENKNSYFPLLTRIAAGDFASIGSEKALYDLFIHAAQDEGFLRDPEELASFNFALSIHSAAPRIEAHYHYYDTALEPLMGKLYNPNCSVWLQWSHKQVCDTTGDILSMLKSWERYPNERKKLQFDRVLEIDADKPAAILYGDVQAPEFKRFHEILSDYANQGTITYRIRYRPPLTREERPVILSGYGVELVLKKTDYIVMDDRDVESDEESVKQKGPNGGEPTPIGELNDQEVQDIKPLHPKDIAFLGTKAASFVMNSEDPFNTLQRLLQDFPNHASSVAAFDINKDVANELRHNWERVGVEPGSNGLWINGVPLQTNVDAFSLLDHIRKEKTYINSLRALGLNSSEAIQILSHDILAEAQQNEQPQRFDYRDTIEGYNIIVWLNDLEKDKRYVDWSESVSGLLRRVYPGQLPSVKKNIHHLILPIDLSAQDDLLLVAEQLQMFVQRKIAIRFGIVPLTTTPEASAQAKVFYHLVETYGLSVAIKYLEESVVKNDYAKPSKNIFDNIREIATLRKEKSALSFEEVEASEVLENIAQKAKAWGVRLGAHSKVPPVFINGLAIARDESWLQQMGGRLQLDVQFTQRAVFEKIADDSTDFTALLLENAATRRNPYIFPENPLAIKLVNTAELTQEYADIFKSLPAIFSDQTEAPFNSDLWIIGDFDEEDGYQLLQSAANLQRSTPGINLVLINNPQLTTPNPTLSSLLHQLQQVDFFKTPESLQKLLEEAPPAKSHVNLPKVANLIEGYQPDVKAESWRFPDNIESGIFWKKSQKLVDAVGLKPGQRGIVINGRVIGPIAINDDFTSEGFEQLLEYESSRRIKPVLEAAAALGVSGKIKSPAKLINIVALSGVPDSVGIFESAPTARTNEADKSWKGEHTSITIGDKEKAVFQIIASIDPASEVAQKLVPILKVFSEMDGVFLKVFLNPQRKMEELPIKRFYRQVLNSAPLFDHSGRLISPRARFENIPAKPLLSLSMDVPPSWLVTPKECIYDLDNLKLESLVDRLKGADIEALYELRSILIEGHSRDVATGEPPRGAQLVLGTEKEPHFADTIIMANLGYFQFKANPGFWRMDLKEGRSKEIFNIDSPGTKGYSSKEKDEDAEIALISFQGATLFPALSRKPGMEREDVLEFASKSSGAEQLVQKWWKKAEKILVDTGLLAPAADEAKPKADINIFSVASGHLYERFLNIMILSVMKHTDKSVKFWFIENFLSPSFKDFIPTMAKEYGFEYELVTYKWPHWLRAQKEKQREIWGYKILFLDVLFPLDVDKVIFVDADQIVRTDMKELVDLDLHGAPYGFTPMCDSREEIEGFRFWKQGYWKNFLRGLPYHISALYVVDLKRFRQIAAGDRLRQQYHQLSADPQSLANLDQDLPNHMQTMLPIYSLPQEWLWCETWCSDESLKTAKTIDLCNNPMTKEPKLDRARRQVPEWSGYDNEVAELARRRVKKEGGVVGHLTDVLKESPVASKEAKEVEEEVDVPKRDEL
ncbi:killer toxin resistant protein [Rhizina undulata]